MSSDSQVVESWITSFCSLLGHEYFAEVSEDFIEDDFNLTGLASQVPMYKEALEMILDVEPEEDDEEEEEEEEEDEDEELGDDATLPYRRAGDRRTSKTNQDINIIESSAELLYGLIHQRYITSRPGIGQMHEKCEAGHFGSCPRVFCNGCKVLPVGTSDTPGQDTVKLFCPSCLDTYNPPNSRFQNVDGAFFGTTFGCLFLMTFPDIQLSSQQANTLSPSSSSSDRPAPQVSTQADQPTEVNGVSTSNFAPGLGTGNIYEPRIYGFKVSERAKTGPRMQWLRMKPDDIRELDESRKYHSEDMDEEYAADEDPVNNSVSQQPLDKRKKAPIRRRRRLNSGDNSAPMETNGVNGAR